MNTIMKKEAIEIPNTPFAFIWIMAIPSLLLLSFITRRSAGFLINYLTVYARTASIKKLFEHLSLHSLSYFNDRFSGALSSKVNDVGSNVAHMIVQFIYEILGVLFALALVVVILFSTKPILALIFISSVVILIPLNLVITRKQIKLLFNSTLGDFLKLTVLIKPLESIGKQMLEVITLERKLF